ncbi:ADP-ribosyltransferase [Streptomyces sp. PSRA5]|uniref:ADP-ribosyltransferase n=1 Tax=Streptomyces panacea TaxID=3035064 RepID=UPI00339BAF7D
MRIRRVLARGQAQAPAPSRQNGQSTAEYVGVTAFVGLVIGAVVLSTGNGATVGDGLVRAVGCVTAGAIGVCEGGGSDEGGGGGDDGPPDLNLSQKAVVGGDGSGPDLKNKRIVRGGQLDSNLNPIRPGPRDILMDLRRHPPSKPKVLCKRGSVVVANQCHTNPLQFHGGESEAEMFEKAAKLAEEAADLGENYVFPDDWLHNTDLLNEMVNAVEIGPDGKPIAKRGLVTAPFIAALAPEVLIPLAVIAAGILLWHAFSSNSEPPPPPSPTASPFESGFASSTLLWTSVAAAQATSPPPTEPAEPIEEDEADTPADPMHALDDIPRYRPGMGPVRQGWAAEVAEAAGRNPLTEDLTAADALAVADYTGPWALDMNNYLRGRPIPGNRRDQINDRIERMDMALRHLPPVRATVYRGTFMPADTIERFARGDQVGLPEYLSTSTDRDRANRGVVAANGGSTPGENVLVEIETNHGRNIDPLSRYRGRESEVLIPRGGTFEQTRTGTTRIDGKEYKVIYLKQTDG